MGCRARWGVLLGGCALQGRRRQMGLVGLCWQGVQANVLAEGGCIIRTADSRVLPFFHRTLQIYTNNGPA